MPERNSPFVTLGLTNDKRLRPELKHFKPRLKRCNCSIQSCGINRLRAWAQRLPARKPRQEQPERLGLTQKSRFISVAFGLPVHLSFMMLIII